MQIFLDHAILLPCRLAIIVVVLCHLSGDLSAQTETDKHVSTQETDVLYNAAQAGNLKLVQTLLEQGVHVDSVGGNGETALMGAVSRGHLQVVEYLISKGADVNRHATKGVTFSFGKISFTIPSGYTPLMMAAEGNHPDIAKTLIKAGAEVEARATNGDTALMIAEANPEGEACVDVLKTAGARSHFNILHYTACLIVFGAAVGIFILYRGVLKKSQRKPS